MTTLDAAWLADQPLPQPDGDTDKNARGRVLVAGGSMRVPGALRLTGEAALRAGAGKVQLATVEKAAVGLGLGMPEVAVIGLPASPEGELASAAGKKLVIYLDRCDALVLGPGMGGEADAAAVLRAVLESDSPAWSLVIDAAALVVAPQWAEAIRARNGRVVLTPHPGELAALMQCSESDVRDAPGRVARNAAEHFGATVIAKGAESWVAAPGEALLRYPGGGPGLATGGSGDVLAGIVGGLLARGASPRVAAAWAVWCHGEAGRRLGARIGPLGFLSRELLIEVPGLLNVQLQNDRAVGSTR